MAASLVPQRFVLASNNAHKLREFTALLAPHGIEAAPAPQPVACAETGDTFAENALQKARAVRQAMDAAGEAPSWILADDSGLSVDALGGAPGVRSARYAPPVPPGGDQDAANRDALAEALRNLDWPAPAPGHAARFICALVALPPEAHAAPHTACGELGGWVVAEARGAQGFGYDSMFMPQSDGGERLGGTLAELGPAVKDSLSHRSLALLGLLRALRGG